MKALSPRSLTLASLCLACLLAGAWRASAQPGGKVPPPLTFAIVDLGKLTTNLDESKVLRDRVTAQTADYQKRVDEVRDELKKVTDELEAMKDKTGTPEYLSKLARSYELQGTLKVRGEGLQELIHIAQGDNMKTLFAKCIEGVARVGKERGLDLILWDDRGIAPPTVPATDAQVLSAVQNRRVLYATERIDITDEVLTLMNDAYKIGKR